MAVPASHKKIQNVICRESTGLMSHFQSARALHQCLSIDPPPTEEERKDAQRKWSFAGTTALTPLFGRSCSSYCSLVTLHPFPTTSFPYRPPPLSKQFGKADGSPTTSWDSCTALLSSSIFLMPSAYWPHFWATFKQRQWNKAKDLETLDWDIVFNCTLMALQWKEAKAVSFQPSPFSLLQFTPCFHTID